MEERRLFGDFSEQRRPLLTANNKTHTGPGHWSTRVHAVLTRVLWSSHLSCPSLVLVFLLRLAILDLWLVFRAGPTLMEVFSKGVATMETLAPLCGGSRTRHWRFLFLTPSVWLQVVLQAAAPHPSNPHPSTDVCRHVVRSSDENRTRTRVLLNDRTFSMSSTTSVWTRPCTASPLTWVMRSPSLSPASWAGPPSSTC